MPLRDDWSPQHIRQSGPDTVRDVLGNAALAQEYDLPALRELIGDTEQFSGPEWDQLRREQGL